MLVTYHTIISIDTIYTSSFSNGNERMKKQLNYILNKNIKILIQNIV